MDTDCVAGRPPTRTTDRAALGGAVRADAFSFTSHTEPSRMESTVSDRAALQVPRPGDRGVGAVGAAVGAGERPARRHDAGGRLDDLGDGEPAATRSMVLVTVTGTVVFEVAITTCCEPGVAPHAYDESTRPPVGAVSVMSHCGADGEVAGALRHADHEVERGGARSAAGHGDAEGGAGQQAAGWRR